MQRRKAACFIILFSIFLNGPASTRQSESQNFFPISSFQLENGLHVILSEDYTLPLVSVVIAYKVGSMHEQPGKTGLAYLLENLMFLGSQNIRKMQHVTFIQRIGGRLNALTGADKTIYYQTAPSHQLASVLWMESDRMNSLIITDAKVHQAKEAILGELQRRKMTEPYRENFLLFDKLLFPEFPFSRSLLGNEGDIRELTVADANEFYKTYYCPNNAVLCITGNIDKRKTTALIRKYFGTIRSHKPIPPFQAPQKPVEEELKEIVENPLASKPAFFLGYSMPSPYSPDYYALGLVEYILLQGKSSRLYKKLKKENLVAQLDGGIEKRYDRAVFKVLILSNNEAAKERSQKEIFAEIMKLRTTLVPQEELNKAKNFLKRAFINRFATSEQKALYLVESFLSGKVLDRLHDDIEKYSAVTPEKIIGVANRYFKQNQSIILDIRVK